MRLLSRLSLMFLLLAGCATTGPKGPPPTPTGPAVIEDKAASAYSALATGDYEKAVSLFRELAAEAKPPRLQEYQLGAAEALINAERLPEATQALEVDPKRMATRDRFRLQLLQARLALKKRDAESALSLTARPVVTVTEPLLLAEYYLLRGIAYAQLNNPLEAARAYSLRGKYLADPAMELGNQRATLEALLQISEPVLLALRTAPPPDLFSGWMELSRIGKSRLTPSELEAALAKWRARYPTHPAREEILATLRERAQKLGAPPSNIALLLPFTGNLREAATAVRDGVIAAHYASANRANVQLRTYDTGADPKSVLDAYQQAVQDGADFIIGPLRKEEVEALAAEGVSVPVLALNNLDSGEAPDRLYQFGLAPDDEARQVAERAWQDGHAHAAVITPAGPWGARTEKAFRDRWIELGGMVTASANYAPQESDYGGTLRAMLKLDESGQRNRRLERLLGRNLEFMPRRRQDIDFIFLAAFPRQARLLRPQIKFYHADDVPIYATSHIFTGTVTPEEDRDMDGTVFGDMPWVLEGLQPPALKRHDGQMARLVALGEDAYNVLPYLRLLENYPGERFEGGTGTLQVDNQRRVHRLLTWARFKAGRPQTLSAPR